MLDFFKKKSNEKEEITLDLERIPVHIAIIMDGNGRWANQKGLPRVMGHREGMKSIRRIVDECNSLGVKFLTLYAFSTENWKRPKDEVSALMNLIVEFLNKELEDLHKNNVIFRTIGDITKLPQICQDTIENAKIKTKNNTGLTLNIALNYGGRDEIILAVKEICSEVKDEKLSISSINEELFSSYLYTDGMPDPDLIIRPSGEQRLSNYLLWQSAYAEFWYSDINWPDFKEEDLHRAIADFQNRDRRFGGVK
ncbi:MAG: isoprenyl transferase [Clostridium argentinense]|uniref:Isoprenyl transferase n=1 Tax=Clostridium faecium TaxID=2762223 RepID=A0ABR8YWA9_9CLOT|nr:MULTISPECIES: isoprenyl transferase [Clostridium]MBD8048114.1 isoprenyl transferase [Clostridium faecium]MBS5823755.1 isoprenyl transferase [Clostridium argentinense]MDU1348153.1 isoprenyl transferase [Clostridium argentinense]